MVDVQRLQANLQEAEILIAALRNRCADLSVQLTQAQAKVAALEGAKEDGEKAVQGSE